jgi:hypothetical protein
MYEKKNFSSLFFVAVFGSANRDKHPGSATLLPTGHFFTNALSVPGRGISLKAAVEKMAAMRRDAPLTGVGGEAHRPLLLNTSHQLLQMRVSVVNCINKNCHRTITDIVPYRVPNVVLNSCGCLLSNINVKKKKWKTLYSCVEK